MTPYYDGAESQRQRPVDSNLSELTQANAQANAQATPKTPQMTSNIQLYKIAVAGASGRMGQMLIDAITSDPTCELVGALEHTASDSLGRDAGALLGRKTGVFITSNVDVALAPADFLIDFTRPEATLENLVACRKHQVKAVIGTTGFDAAGKQIIAQHARAGATVFAPNMSVGLNATLKVIALAAKLLDNGFDVEIFEAHHKQKIDAPSGTALIMGEVVAKATGRTLEADAVYARHGVTGARDPRTIGFSVFRGGDIVGDHTVTFAGIGERIEISHKAASRMTYALGSVRACKFLAQQGAGLYSMQDVLE